MKTSRREITTQVKHTNMKKMIDNGSEIIPNLTFQYKSYTHDELRHHANVRPISHFSNLSQQNLRRTAVINIDS